MLLFESKHRDTASLEHSIEAPLTENTSIWTALDSEKLLCWWRFVPQSFTRWHAVNTLRFGLHFMLHLCTYYFLICIMKCIILHNYCQYFFAFTLFKRFSMLQMTPIYMWQPESSLMMIGYFILYLTHFHSYIIIYSAILVCPKIRIDMRSK